MTTPATPHDHVRHNRAFWDTDADDYQALHGAALAERPLAWGAWRAPEADLGVLGVVAGADMLELGCGAAQWSIALAASGAHTTGLDLSGAQLRHARTNASRAHAEIALVQASGETLPFADESFDAVFCDHGAMSFCDPHRTVPEAARVLRRGGLLAFCTAHPLVYLTWDARRERQGRTLQRGYDDLGRVALGDGTVDFVLPPGDWFRLLLAHGLDVEDLIELRAAKGTTTTYTDFVPTAWARRWPAEQIWKARRR